MPVSYLCLAANELDLLVIVKGFELFIRIPIKRGKKMILVDRLFDFAVLLFQKLLSKGK